MKDRIIAIFLQEYFITKRSLEVIFDLFIYSTITIVLFGFVAKYLAGTNVAAAYYLVIGLLLWEVVRVTQYSITVAVMWNVWSRNLSNMFVSPLSATEYFIALMITSSIKSALVVIILSVIIYYVSGFDVLRIGFVNILLSFINLSIFFFFLGIVITGLIFRFGTRIQALSWGLILLFQPLSATFFPITILPKPLQILSFFIPITHVFESARKNYLNQTTDWGSFFLALILNAVYFVFSCLLFYYMFKKSRQTGQFARNEG